MEEARRLASVRLRGLGDVELDIPSGLPPVRLGQRRLVQVLLNLLLNAADAVESAVPARRARILPDGGDSHGGEPARGRRSLRPHSDGGVGSRLSGVGIVIQAAQREHRYRHHPYF
ncbi:hypothetical protein [Archangium violaceum]|uniref:hypothetical protein n=1 Tax=Archangium violaceum TaxID=83451 RepID=UPI0037BFD378